MSSATAPARSDEQRLRALKVANESRTFRARERRKLKKLDRPEAEGRIVEIMRDPPRQMATMKVLDLLLACPKVGRVKANRMLTRLRISPSKSLAGLTERQRDELVRELGA